MDSNPDILDQLRLETDQILHEFAFFKGDIVFLRHVIDRYFIRMTRIENLEQFRGCVGRFQHIQILHKSLLQQLKQHLSRIVLASNQESTVFEYTLFKVHLNFCSRMRQFISEYLSLRTEILNLTNDHIDEDQDLNKAMFSGHLLSPN